MCNKDVLASCSRTSPSPFLPPSFLPRCDFIEKESAFVTKKKMATIVKTSGSAELLTTETGEIIEEILGPRDGSSINYSLAKVLLPPGKSSANHYHPVCEESYHFIAGKSFAHKRFPDPFLLSLFTLRDDDD